MVAIKIKLMPLSPETDREQIKQKAEEIITKADGIQLKFSEEPIAFGLVAVIAFFGREENNSTDDLLKDLESIEEVNSAQIIDIRRVIG